MLDGSLYHRINERYGFAIPSEYRQMYERGWFDFDPARRGLPQPYLWLNDMEWMPPRDILAHEFPSYCKPGFVPFAFTGGGNHWCWYPQHTMNGITPVVLCPHDCYTGEFYAPHFLGSLYRQILDFACDLINPDQEEEARTNLKQWLDDLGPFFPVEWRETIASLHATPLRSWQVRSISGHAFLLPDEYQSIVQRDLAFARLDETFLWMEAV